ncbi:MAG: ribonuclease H-like domain-containing protein [Promethearchaeia archaeon]
MDYASEFDVTEIIEKYKGTKLEDHFPNSKIISNEMGKFMQIKWEIEFNDFKLDISKTKRSIIHNLKVVNYIGNYFDNYFRGRGIKNLYDLLYHIKYNKSAKEILEQIKNKDYKKLSKNREISDIELSFCFNIEDFLFIDIETLGIHDSPIIIIGIGYFQDNKYIIENLIAREPEEEISMLEYFKDNILPLFKCFISYNGKTFDIPQIANRLLYYFDENPLISEKDKPYEDINTLYHHIDLCYSCRKLFRGKLNEFSLTSIENNVINIKRENTLPSHMVGFCYRRYLEDPERFIGLMKECIEHNYYDLYSLPLIYGELLKAI